MLMSPPVTDTPARRMAFAGCWAVVATCGLGLAVWLVQAWWANPETADRLLIFPPAAWLLYRRRAALRRPGAPVWQGLLLIAPAALLAPPSWYLTRFVGPRSLLVWWLAVLWAAALLGL